MARKLLKMNIYGDVQGVGFRFESMRKAKELGLSGFSRNERDGSVYIEARGDRENLEKFLHWSKYHGPPSAKVAKVDFTLANISKFTNGKDYQGFKAIY